MWPPVAFRAAGVRARGIQVLHVSWISLLMQRDGFKMFGNPGLPPQFAFDPDTEGIGGVGFPGIITDGGVADGCVCRTGPTHFRTWLGSSGGGRRRCSRPGAASGRGGGPACGPGARCARSSGLNRFSVRGAHPGRGARQAAGHRASGTGRCSQGGRRYRRKSAPTTPVPTIITRPVTLRARSSRDGTGRPEPEPGNHRDNCSCRPGGHRQSFAPTA